jgi:hypothetical protein
MDPAGDISPCPFCGAGEPDPMEVDRNSWAMVCIRCGAIGPVGRGQQEGVALWNNRCATAPVAANYEI